MIFYIHFESQIFALFDVFRTHHWRHFISLLMLNVYTYETKINIVFPFNLAVYNSTTLVILTLGWCWNFANSYPMWKLPKSNNVGYVKRGQCLPPLPKNPMSGLLYSTCQPIKVSSEWNAGKYAIFQGEMEFKNSGKQIWAHRLRTPNEAFIHWNPELLGLGKQIGQINSGAFGVFSAELSALGI